MSGPVVRVAVPVPLHRLFDYLAPAGQDVRPGCRVRVPFGRSQAIGIVVAIGVVAECPAERLKSVVAVLDAEPLLAGPDRDFLLWVARYYHHPVGEVLLGALPARLRRSDRAVRLEEPAWGLTPAGLRRAEDPPSRAPRQAQILTWLAMQPNATATRALLKTALPRAEASLRSLCEKGWVETCEIEAAPDEVGGEAVGPPLSAEQRSAVETVCRRLAGFSVNLLDGVTGSGKTEVYLRLATEVLAAGRSVLVLVPEISLTPQLLTRFRARLGPTVRVLHSGLTDVEREVTWHRARRGLSRVLLGTRSAVFTPMPHLGLVVVDEEHDPSFKQVEGFRYSARDLAVIRAQRAECPVILGSATPALESLRNAREGRYRHLRLRHRAGEARPPRVDLIDLRDQPLQSGLSTPLIRQVVSALQAGDQVMLFLNRRGFAPVLSCFSCGWVSDCPHCDAHQTWHRRSGLLWCHHCGAQRRAPERCPDCDSTEVYPLGQGTEQLETFLAERFAGVPLVRIDRDATARKGSLEAQLARLDEPGPALLVGTQMIAKGHHFPRVTLVGVVDADGGLYSADFRATERLAQLLVQVAGRAGRGEHPGRVLIQSRFPDHPLLQTLVREGYRGFALAALEERRAAGLPPFSHQALVRADARDMAHARAYLEEAASRLSTQTRGASGELAVWGPVPAPMARRGGRQRAQLLLQGERREVLHRALDRLVGELATLPGAARVRWSLDIDPIDLY